MGQDPKPKVPENIVRCTICGADYDRNDTTAALAHITGGNHKKNVRATPDQMKTITERKK